MKRLIFLLTISFLAGCSWFTKTVYVDKPIYMFPPDYLTQDCEISQMKGRTVADVIDLAIRREQDLEDCNLDKAGIRAWKIKSSPKEEEPQTKK